MKFGTSAPQNSNMGHCNADPSEYLTHEAAVQIELQLVTEENPSPIILWPRHSFRHRLDGPLWCTVRCRLQATCIKSLATVIREVDVPLNYTNLETIALQSDQALLATSLEWQMSL
ncbi:hypothetical protein TNCV_413391 [Trichonephila clavipes]|nr:hypothetical protein TNCV_413391 [Trichonephila clavipes]